MSRRPRMTSADYLTIAVSPALIMTLIGSLVFFLVDVLYMGSYGGRVNYVFALFVFAAVLIGRISIEEGVERASLFAIPLALATWFVLGRFVTHSGPLSPLINLAIIGLIWWWAHKLTWDCTVIDDRQDASGEGLLQAAGLAGGRVEHRDADLDEAETTSWWERFRRRRSRRQVPGLWVLYLSLGALPLFGFLQRAIPLGAADRRDYSFRLLALYVASALGLLLSTSFLGLRRYLRQRRLQMPAPMAATWVVTGGVLILAVMVLAALLPRPAAEVAVSRLPFRLTSRNDQSAAHRAPRRTDGVRQDSKGAGDRTDGDGPEQSDPPGARLDAERRPAGRDQNGTRQDDQRPSAQSDDRQPPDDPSSSDPSSDDPSSDDPSSDDPSSGDRSSDDRSSGTPRDDSPQDDARNQSERPSDGASSGGRPSRTGSERGDEDQSAAAARRDGSGGNDSESARGTSGESTDDDQTPQGEARGRGQGGTSRADGQQQGGGEGRDRRDEGTEQAPASGSNGPRSTPPRSRMGIGLSAGTSLLGAIFKLLFYALLICVIGWLLWQNRDQIGPALRRLVEQLRELWARLFGGRAAASTESADAAVPSERQRQRRFTDFRDPFTTGAVDGMPPAAVVAYTLAAFQAWACDRGHPRRDYLTPRELVRTAAPGSSPLAKSASLLAELHSQAAYGGGGLSDRQVHQLQPLWREMRAHPAPRPPEPARVGTIPQEAPPRTDRE